jgi:hypothetical protein
MPIPTYIDNMVLAAGVAETYTVPSGYKYAVLSGTSNFYIRVNAAAAVPSTEVADGSGSFLNPSCLDIRGATTISFISPVACVVSIALFK